MTRRDVVRIVALYAVSLAGASLAWIALFHTPVLAGSVFFYRGLLLLALVGIVLAVVLVGLARSAFRGLIGVRDVLLVLSLLLSVNVVFFTHLPVTADRSISVFMLAFMNRADGPLTADQIADSVVSEYMLERDAIGKRLEEQLVTGTLVATDGGYVISDEGRSLVGLYELIARAFNIDTPNLDP